MNRKATGFIIGLIIMLALGASSAHASYVTITPQERYYEVIIDYQQALQAGQTPYEIGANYGRELIALEAQGLPVRTMIDGFVAEYAFVNAWARLSATQQEITDEAIFEQAIREIQMAAELKSQIRPEYRQELNGLASALCNTTDDLPGDGQLSPNELDFYNLLADLFLAPDESSTGCSGLAVYGARSATGHPMTVFLGDLYRGDLFAALHAVTVIRNGAYSVAFIGFLGFLDGPTILNEDGVFLGDLDSKHGDTAYRVNTWSLSGKQPHLFAARHALEQAVTVQDVANEMADPQHQYMFGFSLILSDTHSAAILEIDAERRGLRWDASPLRSGLTWGFSQAVAAVNSFLLEGYTDNHTMKSENTARWNSYREQIQAAGETITWEELKQIASFAGKNAQPDFWTTGDIYNEMTTQIIAFDPELLKLDVFFRTTDVDLPSTPDFIHVPIDFGESGGTPPDSTPSPDGASVPEPSTGLLMGGGFLFMLGIRRLFRYRRPQ